MLNTDPSSSCIHFRISFYSYLMKSFLFRFRFLKTNRFSFSFYKTKRNHFCFYFHFITKIGLVVVVVVVVVVAVVVVVSKWEEYKFQVPDHSVKLYLYEWCSISSRTWLILCILLTIMWSLQHTDLCKYHSENVDKCWLHCIIGRKFNST